MTLFRIKKRAVIRKRAAAMAIAATILGQSITSLAIGPGEALSPSNEAVSQNSGEINVVTSDVPMTMEQTSQDNSSSGSSDGSGQVTAEVMPGNGESAGTTPGSGDAYVETTPGGGDAYVETSSGGDAYVETSSGGDAYVETTPSGSSSSEESSSSSPVVPSLGPGGSGSSGSSSGPMVEGGIIINDSDSSNDSGSNNSSSNDGGSGSTGGSSESSSAGAGASSSAFGQSASSDKELPKIGTDVDSVRPHMTVSDAGNMYNDPVLELVPLATYYAFNGGGGRIDYGYTHYNDGFVYCPSGFQSLKVEQTNVGRWYFRTYTQDRGWGPWAVTNEATPSQGNVQAVMFRVKGYIHTMGEVYYRAVLNDGTVTDWAKGGQACGSIGTGKYIIALTVKLWRNDVEFPYSMEKPMDNAYNEGIYYHDGSISYSMANGGAYTGWAFDADSNQYYFENGQLCTGWKAIDGYNIYFNNNGVALKDLEPVMGLPGSYAIRINKDTRTMYVMTRDGDGNYTIPFKTFMISDGPDTPLGDFKIIEKLRWHFMHKDCYCQFLSRFYGSFLMHSLLYLRADPHSFDAINYNFMDIAKSGGCIRLKAIDAYWIYNNCPMGTPVSVYANMWDKGPIEKDAINQAIPRSQDYDPTDPTLVQQSAADAQAVAQAQQAVAQEEASGYIEPNA